MEAREYQLQVAPDTPASPKTNSKTVVHGDERLSDILDWCVPETLSYEEYLQRVKSGEITAETNKFFVIDDENGQVVISDSIISRGTTFSSKKIVELLATGDVSGLVPIGPQSMNKVLFPENWTGADSPHTYSLPIQSLADTSLVTVNLSNSLLPPDYDEQYAALQKAQIKRIRQLNGFLELYAYGDVPSIPISLDITIQN